MHLSTDRTNLSLRNLTSAGSAADGAGTSRAAVNLESIVKKIMDLKGSQDDKRKDEYERQGARPQTRKTDSDR